jgi:hypothetical protein
MRRQTLRITASTAVFILFLIGLNAIRTTGGQSNLPGALDAKDPITYFIADGSGRTGDRSSDRELALWALEAWQRSGGKNIRLAEASELKALIRLYWAEPGDG